MSENKSPQQRQHNHADLQALQVGSFTLEKRCPKLSIKYRTS